MRSLLFAPANQPRKVRKLSICGADAAVLDLEDAVADSAKVDARAAIASGLSTMTGVTRCVRINGPESGLTGADLDASVSADLDVIVVPKVEAPEQLAAIDTALAHLEYRRGLPPGRIALIALLESARGVLRADTVALEAPDRLRRLAFGAADYAAELGLSPGSDGRELLWARSRIVAASHAARLDPPLDGPFLNLRDAEGLLADTRASRACGFRGRVVIHPDQLAAVHRGYSPTSAAELDRCRRIVTAFEAAERDGNASVQVNGMFVDYPIYRQARDALRQEKA
jgi:citrate lyase subunit beta/citryl-CoA lyase